MLHLMKSNNIVSLDSKYCSVNINNWYKSLWCLLEIPIVNWTCSGQWISGFIHLDIISIWNSYFINIPKIALYWVIWNTSLENADRERTLKPPWTWLLSETKRLLLETIITVWIHKTKCDYLLWLWEVLGNLHRISYALCGIRMLEYSRDFLWKIMRKMYEKISFILRVPGRRGQSLTLLFVN